MDDVAAETCDSGSDSPDSGDQTQGSNRSVTAKVDPFALIATGQPRQMDIPF